MLEKLSIEWKLPLAICTVLMAVVVALSLLAYHEVADSAQRAAAGRVENFASQLAGTFHTSVDKGLVQLSARASREPLIDHLRSPDRTGSVAEAARTALEALLVSVEVPVDFAAVQLFDRDRRPLLAVGPDRDRIAALLADDLIPAHPAETGGVGALVTLGDRVVVPAFVPVLSGEEPLGYVVRWSYVTMSAATREQIIGFLAPEASAYLGSPGGLWIDWERIVPEPSLDLTRPGTMARVERPGGVQLAAAASVAETPWIVVVEYPERLAMAPARRLLERVGAAAVLLLLAGFGGVWFVARRITVRLRELTVVSESLVGDAQADPGTAGRADELGRLRTSFHRMSARVQEAHRRLEAKVGELRAAQQREQTARAQAEAANSRKDEFLAMLAHELRNPLGVIVNAVAVMEQSGGVAAQQRACAMVRRQTKHLVRLLDDLLDVARITLGRIELQLETVDLRAAVEAAVEMQLPDLEGKRQRLTLELPEHALSVNGDPVRLQQVFDNVLDNASKYTPAGGTIRIALAVESDEAVLEVSDSGVGIEEDKLEEVFELFVQLNPSLARTTGGLGIGLTLVRSIVELHGGSVRARSGGSGHGATFVVRLPLAKPTPVAPRRAELAPQLPRRVLVVEDKEDGREILALLLRLQGHEALAAATGREALDVAERESPEIVLLDIGLPDMDGYTVCRELRQRHGERIHLVAVTGYGQPSDRARSSDAGFDAHLVKPVEPDRLAEVLRPRRRPGSSCETTLANGNPA